MPNPRLLAVLVSVLILSGTLADAQTSLRPHNSATQLLVDGKPFLMLGVETTNKLLDDPSDLPHLDENLAVYKAACVNTVLIPVTRKTFEPVEDQYDTTMIDALIAGCRPHDHKLVVLWFGAIKNGQGGFTPRWFVDDRQRFYRAQQPDGTEGFCISPFCQAAVEAAGEAFVLLMRRIKEKDPEGDIVTTVQPENETGYARLQDERDSAPRLTNPGPSPFRYPARPRFLSRGCARGKPGCSWR